MASRKAIVLGATLPSSRTRLQFILNQCKRNVRCSSEVSRRFKSSVSPSYQEDDDDNTYDTSSYPVQLPPKLLALVKTAKTTPTVTAARQKRESTVQPGPLLSQQEIDEKFFVSPSELVYPGNATIPITSHLHIVKPGEDVPRGKWPIFRLMDEDGTFRDGNNDGYKDFPTFTSFVTSSASAFAIDENDHDALSGLRTSLRQAYPNHAEEIEKNGLFRPSKFNYADTNSRDTLERAYRQMVRVREMDTILQNTQRQGRISFYMTSRGEEAMHFGAASALEPHDVVLAQYREQGVLMWRGFTLQQFTDQCFSNEGDLGKGRQMPVHYGSRALNYQTISSCLGTQIPQAAGAAYRMKLSGKDAIAACFFGDGCTSTTDFHSGLNFAATLRCPVIFFCRNNGYAISTSVKDQYAGDGVVSRGPGYGMASIRVDGNDIFAVHAAVREARAYALEHSAPVLIEGMSYRQGHHSTSDDSLRYRSAEEIENFAKDGSDPLLRLQNFLKLQDYRNMNDDTFQATVHNEKMAVLDAMKNAERKSKPPLESLFEDVFVQMPTSLKAQQQQLNEHLAKYHDKY